MKLRISLSILALLFLLTPSSFAQKNKKSSEVKNGTVTFYIARHGKTILNTLDRVQGWSDAPLTPAGIEVAEFLGKGLVGIPFKAAYSSDLGRATQTARLVLDAKGDKNMPIQELVGLRETCFGSYEGELNAKMWGDAALYLHYKTTAELFEVIKEKGVEMAVNAFQELETLGMGERYNVVKERTFAALTQIAINEAKNGGGNVFVVSHGMAIGTMLSNITDKKAGHMGNASISKVTYTDGVWNVETIGDMSFVEKGKIN